MSKLTKVLSVLLAMVLLFSTASIGVEAAYNGYKDDAITRYDAIDKPVLTPAQYASMAMDEVDRMLGEANIKIEYDVAGMIGINADFTSVDKALKSVGDLYNSVKSMLSTIGGDIQYLNFSALVNESGVPVVTRSTSGKTDADIFVALLKFLKDNSDIIAKVPKGSKDNGGLDLGILSGFIDLGDKLNVPLMAKEALAGLVWPDTPKAQLNTSLTVDQYVSTFIEEVASGDYAKFKEGIGGLKDASKLVAKYLPGLTDKVDFLNDSVYDLFNKGAKIAINDVVIPYTNPRVLALLGRLCGYDYTKTKDEDGDTIWVRTPADKREDEPNAMTRVINWHEGADGKITGYNLQPFTFDDGWIFDSLNTILGKIVEEVLSIEVEWDYDHGNSALLDNVIVVAKAILAETGDALFASYIEVLTPEEIDDLDDEEFLAYVLRSVLNASISFVYIHNDCDTILEVLFELVKQLAADFVPQQDYSDLDPDLDGIIAIGLDLAAYGLNGIVDMNLEYGMDLDDFADTCVEWIQDNYGGFLPAIEGNNGWDKVSYVLFNLIPANWLSTRPDGSERDNVYDLIMYDVVENLLNLDFDPILTLLDKNTTGELNGTLIEVILARLTGIVNFILPGVFPARTYNNLETLLDTNLLSTVIKNLLSKLYDRAAAGIADQTANASNNLLYAVIPVVCMVLDLSDPETFGYPYISLEDQHTAGASVLTSFYMYNGSSGLNTAATNKNGVRTQDKLYQYQIRSVTTSNPAVTVSPTSGTINGGDKQTFTLDNVAAAMNEVLKVTITYDVLSEKGTVMTPNPLTATTYTYIYDSQNIFEDNVRTKADQTAQNMHLIYYKPATYMSTDSTLGELEDYTMDLQRNKSENSATHQNDATFSVDGVTIDATLESKGVSANIPFSVSTNKNPSSKEYKPYKVSNKDAKLDEGNYTNTWQFKATPSHSADEIILFYHNVFVYDDFGLNGLLRSAVSSDRQEANYAKGRGFTAKYVKFDSRDKSADELTDADYENVTGINGTAAWNRYTAAVDAAAAIIYAPRLISSMQTFVDNGDFETAARELYAATKELEGCSVSGGTANIKSALEAIVPSDTHIVDGEEVEYEYDETGYPYFGRADYINYTYGNFKSEMRTAERILDAEETAINKGEPYQIEAIRAAYVAHRVSLYGERLVRVRAYKTYLQEALDTYADIFNAGNFDSTGAKRYKTLTWNDFEKAYNFATLVNGEAIGSTIGSTENLAGEGLRQTKVNKARAYLVKAAKRLEEAKPTVDYTQIEALIAEAADTYDAGNDEGAWTELSWNTFTEAYDAAVRIVAQELEAGDANQRKVTAAYNALDAAFKGLEAISQGGDWSILPDEDLESYPMLLETEDSGMIYVTGLSAMEPYVSDYLEYSGAYEVEVEENAIGAESTGAIVKVYYNGELIEEYPIVLYGDTNGDCVCNAMDKSQMLYAEGNSPKCPWLGFLCPDESPNAFAADLNHDGVINGNDRSIVSLIESGKKVYNQCWEAWGDPLYV